MFQLKNILVCTLRITQFSDLRKQDTRSAPIGSDTLIYKVSVYAKTVNM